MFSFYQEKGFPPQRFSNLLISLWQQLIPFPKTYHILTIRNLQHSVFGSDPQPSALVFTDKFY